MINIRLLAQLIGLGTAGTARQWLLDPTYFLSFALKHTIIGKVSTSHTDYTAKKANQSLGFLKRNIRVRYKDLKSNAYKTLLEYDSTVWYPTTTKIKNKVEAVTAMLKILNWRPLDQSRIDSSLLIMYTVTYDLVAIPAPECLARNTRQSRYIHSLV